ncbi:EcsC family protein [Acinetobacter modestus]|uniref:EcsC family protein n=1 Tax=Acinetobacter modestus TaxID=1776740 RepID=UPI00202E1DE4|nr:EcsC family protein [Acinetobacter modestus]MCM1958317.1 EcsC family protein [Acinetobacter modestus]
MNIKENQQDYKDLKMAAELLTNPSITAQISNIVGSPLEKMVENLPTKLRNSIQETVSSALHKAINGAVKTMNNEQTKASTIKHKLMAAVSGALGGAFGAPALILEIPISTTIIMRAVADIARSEGFDVNDMETKRMCLEVFSLGGITKADDGSDTGYYFTRMALNEVMKSFNKEMSKLVVEKGITRLTPAQVGAMMAKLVETVAAKFGIVITGKIASQVVPVVGAVTGATINSLFVDYYQDMALGHFTIKRLEKKYDFEHLREEFEKLTKK